MPPLSARLCVLVLALPLAGCIGQLFSSEPPRTAATSNLYTRLETTAVSVNPAEAASIISGYRANNGRGRVVVSPRLNAIAASQAKAMAAADRMSHSVGGSFQSRMAAGGYDAAVAAENIGAGYRTLAEAFSGWRDSRPHRANMLLDGVTEIGIATAYAPGSKYQVYWSLVLAGPDKDRDGPKSR